MLIAAFALTACGKSKETEEPSTVNLPVVDVGGEADAADNQDAVDPPEQENQNEQAYPIEEINPPQPIDPAIAYPADPTSPEFNAQMEEYLKQLFGDEHTLESLLEKDLTAVQWREVLTDSDHMHLNLGETAIQMIIDWFMSR